MSVETKEKTAGQLLSEQLTYQQQHIADIAPESLEKAETFCVGYKKFLDKGKTERECVAFAAELLKKNGYTLFDENKKYVAGDKIYTVNREKAIIAATIGQKGFDEGARLTVAHIDAPRLDLKPNPLYEDKDISLFKTHYYGGIRKYQWGATPLSLHGVVIKNNGEVVTINVGEEENEPVFCVTDLLPHLAAEQCKRTLNEGLKGEELNIVVGSIPYADQDIKDRVKLYTLQILNEKYGITERDFVRAEIEAVPAFKAKDVGFDRSLIGAYGQDDRVCSYTALMAEIENATPTHTSICVLSDKEEIGSDGNTGLNSAYVFHFIEYLAESMGVNYKTVLKNSKCLSADVNAAFDPTFPSVLDPRNACYINKGCVITKYTGARGKYDTNDAAAEMMGFVADILDEAKIPWQIGELGGVDVGGGGTVAKYIANQNVDVVDIGVPILSMHSPFELASKLDVYATYSAFKAFVK